MRDTCAARCGQLIRWLCVGLLGWVLQSSTLAVPAAETPAGSTAAAPVVVVSLEGAVSPVQAEHISAALDSAAREQAALVVLTMDTPGGLDTAMRSIIKAILASPVPVATLVTPAGARAASAGTFILYASHVAAMSPGTNVGAATPVAIGAASDEEKKNASRDKAVNDAAAYLRSLAVLRGRNADWAERAVREADSLDANAALAKKVIDLVATDVSELLRQLDGRRLQAGQRSVQLQLAGAPVREYPQSWRVRVLSVLSDPGIALMLVMLGLAGLFLEFSNPGLLLPGMLGAICLLVGMYALQMLPLNFAGVALLLLGVGLLIAEVFVPGGLLAGGGALALVAAAVMLLKGDLPATQLPPWLVVGIVSLLAIGMAVAVSLAMRTRHRPVQDTSALIGSLAQVLEPTPGGAWVEVRGERWHGSCPAAVVRGQQVRVVGRNGLELRLMADDTISIRSTGD